jgi:glycosyltransferase involved in cell wall biosynthesis
MPRILYLSHDNPRPSGGVRTLYRHVEILRKAGFDAYIVQYQSGFQPGWFSSDVPVLYAEGGLALHAEDWAVIPEDHSLVRSGLENIGCRKAIFCQGHYQIFECIPPAASWMDYGATEVLVSSTPIRDFVRSVFAVEPAYIPLSLDLDLFRPGAEPRKLQLAYMPRKGAHHLRMIQALIHHRAPELEEIPWIPIDGCGEAEVAAILRSSAFFLATGFREGFGLPPLEAMACGAIVVGFRAGGGAEYARQENGFWVPDEDTLALADKLIELLRAYRGGNAGSLWESVRAAGYSAAAQYTRGAEAKRLIEFWSRHAPAAGLGE